MPGTTHARLAQPVTLGHHLLAHAWACSRDLERFAQWADRASTSALGAGATATSTLGLDPAATAERLGMRRAFANSIDAVSDRDFVQEFLAVASIAATHLSRLAADLARWTDESLAWAELDEAYSTGSSMMPQKRNPDTAELVRGKAARVAGDFVAVTAMLHGLPVGYHRDLQEDKEPLFDAVDTLDLVVPAITGAMATVRFDVSAMRDACAAEGLYATDLAEALVKAGVPFREAHRRTGALLKELAGRGGTLTSMTDEEWEAFGVPGRQSAARSRRERRRACVARWSLGAERASPSRCARGVPRRTLRTFASGIAIALASQFRDAQRRAERGVHPDTGSGIAPGSPTDQRPRYRSRDTNTVTG